MLLFRGPHQNGQNGTLKDATLYSVRVSVCLSLSIISVTRAIDMKQLYNTKMAQDQC